MLQTNSLYFRYVRLGKHIVKVQVQFFSRHISTQLGVPCVYILCETQHPCYIEMCVHLTYSQLLIESKCFVMFTDCGPPY